MTLEEINKRALEIKEEINKPDADVDALSKEVDNLEEQRKVLVEKQETRKATLEKIKNGEGQVIEKVEKKEEIKMNDNKKEIRTAYFKKLMGKELTEEERAFTISNADGAMPDEVSNDIITKVTKLAPMINEITTLNVNGNVTFAVEGVKTAAGIHTENATITGDSDTLVKVTLGGYEVTKLVQVSKSVEKMSVSSFDSWLTDMIASMLAEKIEDQIFNGTGTSQATGIDKGITWTTSNSVTVAKTSSLTADNVRSLVALLNAGYDIGAKIAMSKKTLFNDFMGLQDNAKHDLVKEENGNYMIYGYPVLISDKIAEHDAFLGNFKKYVANLAEDINIVKQFDINTNSNKYLGCAMFDGKPAIAEAFVKLTKATV